MKAAYGDDTMPSTGENVAQDFQISRADQDAFALVSQQRAARAQQDGTFDQEIVPVSIPQKKGDPIVFARDEHPRETSLEALAKLKPVVRPSGTVTAGNASGVNDGAAALLVASEAAVERYGLTPLALPAVTVPPARKAGFSVPSFSSDVSGRGCSSSVTSPTGTS